jgi:hypothetical protein
MARSQAALEFLIAYGWAFIAVLIVFGGIIYFIPLNYCPSRTQISLPGVSISDHRLTGVNTDIIPSRNLFYFTLKARVPGIVVEGVQLEEGGVSCGSVHGLYLPLQEGASSRSLIGRITNPLCHGAMKECYSYDLVINYSKDGDFYKLARAMVKGSYESGTELWSLGGRWFTQVPAAGSVLAMENRAGEKINYWLHEPPPPAATFLNESPAGIMFWDLPAGCDTSGITGGFATSASNNRPQLAKTWLHNTLYIDNAFSSYDVYLGGDAVYFDTMTGKQVTNGICLNDNLYFYVNGALKYYGGTTGVRLGPDGQFVAGSEVIRGCGNCNTVDSSAWCIPPFRLDTAGFNFGVDNNIDILVEDFCRGGGAPHAGGMSQLAIQLL